MISYKHRIFLNTEYFHFLSKLKLRLTRQALKIPSLKVVFISYIQLERKNQSPFIMKENYNLISDTPLFSIGR